MEPAIAVELEFRPRLEVGDGDGERTGADDLLELSEELKEVAGGP